MPGRLIEAAQYVADKDQNVIYEVAKNDKVNQQDDDGQWYMSVE